MKLGIELLRERVESAFPRARTELYPPLNGRSSHWLDIFHGDSVIVVEWSPSLGFGITGVVKGVGNGQGQTPDEVVPTLEEAANRIAHLLVTGERTRLEP